MKAPKKMRNGFSVRLMDLDEHEADIILPFAPFVGLCLRVPWLGMDFRTVDEVYWMDDSERFEVYFAEEGE